MLAVLFALFVAPQEPAAAAYDPLAVAKAEPPPTLALVVTDTTRSREIPVRVYLPAATAPAAVILWSHGLGGSRDNSAYLGTHWSARGYVVVCLQHPGSDESVWRGKPPGERMPAMQKAASAQNLVLRCGDVKTVLDQLTAWNGAADHALRGRLDLEHIGMCGHSFGAITTQSVGGQSVPLQGQKFVDRRIDAALPMSPNAPKAGDPERAFADVTIPWLLMTGTEDVAPIGNFTVEDRLAVYPALPTTIDRYELVLDGADHGVFGDGTRRGGTAKAAHHRSILALSTAFWDSHLRGDATAKAWLHGDGARTALAAEDRWQCAPAAVAAAGK
jgi:predicted dienelactone hydrolase